MKNIVLIGLCLILYTLFANNISAQGVPGSLPQMIGGNPSTNPRIDSVNVSGKVSIEGMPASETKPVVYVIIYNLGRLVSKTAVSDNGSFSISDVPRDNLTLNVEINNSEVGSYQLMSNPGNYIRQDVTISWMQLQNSKNKPAVVSGDNLYQRNNENQKLFDKAIASAADRKNDQAVALFKQIIKNDPKDYVSLTRLGNLFFLDEKFSDAEKSYGQAIEQNPDYTLASLNLGKVYLAQKDYDKAIAILSKVVENSPSSADAQHYLGEAYLGAKKGSKAVIYLNEAIRLAPIEKAEIHLRLAALYNGAGLKDRAALEYKMFLNKVPNYPEKEKLEKYIKENSPAQ